MSQSDGPTDTQSSKDGLAQDVTDLHRGVVINAVGNVIKIAHPILLGVAIALYGEVMWGVFVTAQAALLPIGRMAMVGLDKGLLWWVPRQPPGLERLAIRPALVLVVCLTTLIATLIAFVLAPWIAEWKSVPAAEASIRWMSYGLVPMGIMDLLVSACLGRRAMGAQLVVRDVVWPLSQVLVALGLFWMGFKEQGLALSFLISCGVGALAAWYMFRRVFRGTDWPDSGDTLSRPLMKYALPMWGGEVVNSWLMRIDQIIVFAVLGPAQAGVYGVVVMVGNSVRMIRRAFDPIVTAIFSGAQARNDEARMGANFSYATTLVIGSQMPVFAFILVFTPWILPFIGEAYDGAIVPIAIVCGFWLVNGALGLNGLILVGYGRSGLALLNVLIAMAILVPLLYLLVPLYQLEGAALSVGVAYTIQNLIQALQARRLTGAWNYRSDVWWILMISCVSFGAMGATYFLTAGYGDAVMRVSAFVVFLVASGSLIWVGIRAGWFRAVKR